MDLQKQRKQVYIYLQFNRLAFLTCTTDANSSCRCFGDLPSTSDAGLVCLGIACWTVLIYPSKKTCWKIVGRVPAKNGDLARGKEAVTDRDDGIHADQMFTIN